MHSVETITVDGSDMEVFLFRPEGQGPFPGLILAQHLPVAHTGLENDPYTLETGKRFAANGYLVAAPYLFHWWPRDLDMQAKREQSRDDWTVADLSAAYTLLCAQPDVDLARTGIVGHCWGGRVAWLGACHLRGLAAAAIFYGGNIKTGRAAGNPAPIDLAADITCPVAGFFGDDDENPSPADVDDYSEALTTAGVAHEFHRYAGAGHAFQNFAAADRYRELQSEDAWDKVLVFFRQHLNP